MEPTQSSLTAMERETPWLGTPSAWPPDQMSADELLRLRGTGGDEMDLIHLYKEAQGIVERCQIRIRDGTTENLGHGKHE